MVFETKKLSALDWSGAWRIHTRFNFILLNCWSLDAYWIRILTYINAVCLLFVPLSILFIFISFYSIIEFAVWETKDKDEANYYLKWPKQNKKSATISCDCAVWFGVVWCGVYGRSVVYYSLECDETVTFCCRFIFFCHCVRTDTRIQTHTDTFQKKECRLSAMCLMWGHRLSFEKISGVLFCFTISMSNSNLLAIVCDSMIPNESLVLNESCIYLSREISRRFSHCYLFSLVFSTFMQIL